MLEKVKNSVDWIILHAIPYTASSALRGETGAISSTARDMKTEILFAEHLMEEDRNELF